MKAERSPKIPGNESELRGFNPNQPREPNGRFASTGGGAGGGSSNAEKLIDYLKNNPDATTSEIIKFETEEIFGIKPIS